MKAYSPTGSLILGSLETVSGRAEISSFTRDPDGSLAVEYGGETEIFWDEQRTQQRSGKDIYLDENGEEWTEDQLVLKDE